MELNVIEDTKTRLVLEVLGEDATICNFVKKELWNDEKVKIAGYSIEHPLISEPKITVETKSQKPKEALVGAIDRLKKDISKVSKSFQKAAK